MRYPNGKLDLNIFDFDIANVEYLNYQIKPFDRYETLAYEFYGECSDWWVIPLFNQIQNPFITKDMWGKTLKIPKHLDWLKK